MPIGQNVDQRGEPADVEGVDMRRGYPFGLDGQNRGIDSGVPKKPVIQFTVALVIWMDEYPA